MKKLLLTTLFILCSALAFCEIPNVYPYNNNAEYQLYPTTNMWTFLKLDTSTGMIWIVQYSVDDIKDTFEIPLSTSNQNYADYPIISDAKAGRYILYPTQNMYTFIMLDQHNGRTWQVQWGTKSEHRFVKKIKALY